MKKADGRVVVFAVVAAAILLVGAFANTIGDTLAISSNQATVYNSFGALDQCTFLVFVDDGGDTYSQSCDTNSILYGGPNDIGGIDGSDSDSVIQAIVDALPSTGGKVFVRNGNYTIDTSLKLKSNTVFECESWSTWFVSGSPNMVVIRNSDWTNGNHDITLANCAFDGGGGDSTDGTITFEDVTRLTVNRVYSYDSPSEGIKARGGDYTIITDNYVEKTALVGGIGKAGIIAATSSNATIIADNIIVDAGGEAIGAYYNSGFTNIANNVAMIKTSGGRGHILIEGTATSSQQAQQAIITGNNILSDYYGINVITSSNFVISNNVIRHFNTTNALDGIRISGASLYGTITGNNLQNIAQHGISLIDSSRQITVDGNTVINPSMKADNTYHGILVSAAGGFIREPVITDNVIVDDQGNPTMSSGVSLQAGTQQITNLVVMGNVIRGQQASGIAQSGTMDGIVRYNEGFTTESKGTGTIASGATSAAVTHSLSYTPSASECTVTFTENPTNDPGTWFITGISSSQFTINVENDPGASGLDFSWSCRRI